MIDRCFTFLPGIGTHTQQSLEEQGISTWQDFLNEDRIFGISSFRKKYCNRQLKKAQIALRQRDATFFYKLKETWRLYEYFKDDCLFLDIEAGEQKHIIILGVSNGEYCKTFVRGFNLDTKLLAQLVKGTKLLVTFNGSSFDLPIMKRKLGILFSEIPHIDLRHLRASVGLKGGLKEIEKELGITRSEVVQIIPVWNQWYRTRKPELLQKLITYNTEDTIHLKEIVEYCYKKKQSI
jgi:uncharacterized protein YprB with RNaseH-like and TPR domain